MAERRGGFGWRMAILLAAILGIGSAVVLIPAQRAEAYNLMCCPWYTSKVSKLVMAEEPNKYTDNSAWFQGAVVNGVNAWNDSATPVNVSTELYQDNKDIEFYTLQMTSSSQYSIGVCRGWDGAGKCYTAEIELYEGCAGGWCNMTKGTPNYDAYTVAHELGHALGLDHSCVPNVLMSGPPVNNPSCPNGNPPYSYHDETNYIGNPQQDDINGANAMYGSASYQANSGGGAGCAYITTPSLGPVINLVPVPYLPTPSSLPGSALVGSAEQEAGGAASNPVGAGQTAANDASAATAKVVPWSNLPGPGSTTLPAGLGAVNRPC